MMPLMPTTLPYWRATATRRLRGARHMKRSHTQVYTPNNNNLNSLTIRECVGCDGLCCFVLHVPARQWERHALIVGQWLAKHASLARVLRAALQEELAVAQTFSGDERTLNIQS